MTVTGGTAIFNGTVTTGGLTQSGGLLNGTGTLTVSDLSTLSGGTQERVGDDDCAGRGGVHFYGLRARWRADPPAGRQQHGDGDLRPDQS